MDHRALLLALVGAICLAGCGGGRSTPQPGESGGVSFRIRWPAERLIPNAAESIAVTLSYGADWSAQQVAVRPEGGGDAALVFAAVPVGTLVATAAAYPNADGTGVAQATGAVQFETVAGQTANQTLTLDSTIASFAVVPAAADLAVGSTLDLTATAYDSLGAVVLLPNAAAWSLTSGAASLSLTSGRAVTGYTVTARGVAVGEATVQVTFDEGAGTIRTATATITVDNWLWTTRPSIKSPKDVRVDGTGSVLLAGSAEPGAGVTLAKYSASGGELWVKPSLSWRHRYGGLAVNQAGESYFTHSQGLPVAEGWASASRYDPDGTATGSWSLRTGSRFYYPNGAALDSSGNVFLAGAFSTGLVYDLYDGFLAKCDAALGQVWVRELGTAAQEQLQGVATDAAGNVYVAGSTAGDLGGPNAGGTDLFLAKYDAGGNQLWVRQYGTSGDDSASGVAVDGANYVYLTGATTGDLASANAGGSDAFLAQYDAAGDQLWVRQFGFAGSDVGWAVAVDGVGNAYVTGQTSGALAGLHQGGVDVFLAVYSPIGGELWSRQFGTTSDDFGAGVTVDQPGNVYVCGTQGDQPFLARYGPATADRSARRARSGSTTNAGD